MPVQQPNKSISLPTHPEMELVRKHITLTQILKFQDSKMSIQFSASTGGLDGTGQLRLTANNPDGTEYAYTGII